MTTTRTTTVTHPDGTVSTRKSKTMTYAYAVQITQDNHALAAWHRAQAAGLWAVLAELSEIIASGDLSGLGRKHTGSNGLGQKFYSSYVKGDHPYHCLPDHREPAVWAEWIEKYIVNINAQAQEHVAKADTLSAGPQFTYGVYRWSKSAALAAKGADEFTKIGIAGATAQLVEVTVA